MANEKRLIDANALLSKFKEHRDLYAPSWEAFKASSINVKSRVDEIDTCMADVISAPTVDAVEVVHGYWVDKHYKIACSVCEKAVFIGTSDPLIHKEEKKNLKYCPNCGGRMDGVADG